MLAVKEYDRDRFDRSKRIGWVNMDGIGKARCLVVGAGALGNEAVKCLVLSGFRDITIVDTDDIVLSNLNRCVFFRDADVKNGAKAEILAERASALVPDAGISAKVMRIQDFGGWEDVDMIIGCVDNISARMHMNAHACHHGIPYIDGGTDGMIGKVQAVLPGGPCLQCAMNSTHYRAAEIRYSCTGSGASVPYVPKRAAEITTASAVAAMQVREAMKIASGRSDICIKDMAYYDGTSGEVSVLRITKDAACGNHA